MNGNFTEALATLMKKKVNINLIIKMTTDEIKEAAGIEDDIEYHYYMANMAHKYGM